MEKTILEISPAIAAFASTHGAVQDPISKQWYVIGDVPLELLGFVPKQIRRAVPEFGPVCPKCGSHTVKRYRKSDGDGFWGCCRYPTCKGTSTWECTATEQLADIAERVVVREKAEEPSRSACSNRTATPTLKEYWGNVVKEASDRLGGPHAAERWLQTPKVAFGGKKPIELMRTEEGCQQVEVLLAKLFD